MPVKINYTGLLHRASPESIPGKQDEVGANKEEITQAIGKLSVMIMEEGFLFSACYAPDEWENLGKLLRLRLVMEVLVRVLNDPGRNGETIPPEEKQERNVSALKHILRSHGFCFEVVDVVINPDYIVIPLLQLFIKELRGRNLLRDKVSGPE